MEHTPHNMKHGQAALTAVIFFLVAATAIGIGFTSFAFEETATARRQLRAKQSYFLAEAGVEDVAYRIKNAMSYASPETLSLDGSSASTAITDIGLNQKSIIATGDVANAFRKVSLTLSLGQGTEFSYGAQSGYLGIVHQD